LTGQEREYIIYCIEQVEQHCEGKMNQITRNTHQLLHMQIKDAMIKEYCSGNIPENTPCPSMRELVKKFNTSMVTIDKAFKELKKDNIVYSVPQVGTFWGKPKKLTRYNTIGIRFNLASLSYLTPDTYFFNMLRGIEHVLEQHNLNTKLLRYETLDSIDSIRNVNCDGVICTGTYLPVLAAVETFRKLRIPYILLDRPNNDETLNYIEKDSAGNIAGLVDYLAAMGHRKICAIGIKSDLWIEQKLYIGFEEGMKRHGFDSSNSLLLLNDVSTAELQENNASDIIMRHTALIILTPVKNHILEILEYCESRNIKIPEGCSVITLATDTITKGNLTVTSHQITPYEMGIKAAEAITELMNNTSESSPLHIEFPVQIKAGNTTKHPGHIYEQ